MIRFEAFFGFAVLALDIYCVVDVIGRPEGQVRNLPKLVWLVLILFFPLVGSIAYLVTGRPEGVTVRRSSYERATPDFPEYDRPGRTAATNPDDDEDFLRRIRERAEEQRRSYRAERLRQERERDRSKDDGSQGPSTA